MSRNWDSVNGIFVKNIILSMFKERKTKEEIVDFFYNAGNSGHFLWGTSSKESISNAVDEIKEIYYDKPIKTGFFSKLFNCS